MNTHRDCCCARGPAGMRTGLVGYIEPSEAENELMDSVAVLLRTFAREATVIAGRYAHGCRRTCVREEDMRCALKYCARTFFSRLDGELEDMLNEERARMQEEEEDDEDDEGEDGDEDDEGEDDDDEGEDGDDEEEKFSGEVDQNDVRLVHNVNTVVRVWHLWQPDDPVHALLKRAIDNT